MAFKGREEAEVDALSRRYQLSGTLQKDRIVFHGHPLVMALHPTTIEITTEDHLTERGDCIVGVGAERGCAQLTDIVKSGIRRASSRIQIRLVVGADFFTVSASGDPRLTLAHPHDLVVRKSHFISDRTVAVGANAAAKDIPRRMVARLRRPDTVGYLEIEVS
jgi:hypothetical protein